MKLLTRSIIAGAAVAAGALFSSGAEAQPQKISPEYLAGARTVSVVPGADYQAGALHRMIFGDHWRSLWTSPMSVDVLDLRSFAGGLKPFEAGGGFQTLSLRFRGSDGREYRFRSVDKDPSRGMPEKLHNTLVSDVVQDQVSTANPVSVAIIDPFLQRAGILHSPARFVVMPYDREILGEYYDEFAGLLGTIEEHPDENSGGTTAFAGADEVVKTTTLLEMLESDHAQQVDAGGYLTARLIDLFVGDWDRHSGQWRWAGYRTNGGVMWKPVPKDRDNAFSRQDGVFSWVITQIIPQIEGFGDTYADLNYLSWSGRALDRRILPLVSREEWMSRAAELRDMLTDEVIDAAVRNMPPAMYQKEGQQLAADLKSRRDLLPEAAGELYAIYAEDVDLYASDKSEFAVVNRLRDGKVEVSLSADASGANPYFHRVFEPDDTREIRLYMLGGDDQVTLKGTRAEHIDVRVIGGGGKDEIVDQVDTSWRGWKHRAMNYLYDDGDKTRFSPGPYSVVDRRKAPDYEKGIEKYDVVPRDFGKEVVASIANVKIDYAPEYGVFLGWGVTVEDYGFRRDPYNSRIDISGGGAYDGDDLRHRLEFRGDFRSFIDGASLVLEAGTTDLDFINFYGLGNESSFDKNLYDEDDFEIHQQVSWIRPVLHFPADADFQVRTGFDARFVDFDIKKGSWLDSEPDKLPYGIDEDFTGSFLFGLRYDTRSCGDMIELSPRRQAGRLARSHDICKTAALSGMLFDIEGAWYPEFAGNDESFGRLSGEWRGYLPLPSLPYSRLALRAGGEKLWGDFPFYEAAYIGGSRSIRGYDRERFAGDASVYANSELRLYFGTFKFLVPVMFGPLAFIESGRVFLDGEDSDRWHTGYGGGLWFSFVEPRYVLSISVGKGVDSGSLSDDYGIYVRTGFSF
ncbi:MAG: BamA/TamA family outer membrane protein [Prosthecochloris sp.]|nr:BamA/TamA family outer membrane protein [Prosthecochloris sp.]